MSKRRNENFITFLAAGHSVRDIILEMARAHLLDTLLQFAAGGIWLKDDVPMAQVAGESKGKGRDRGSGEENTNGHEGNEANMTDGAAARPGEEEDVGAPRKKTAATHE